MWAPKNRRSAMLPPGRMSFLAMVLTVAWAILLLPACAERQPVPQPKRVVDPSEVQGSIRTPSWNIAAAAYEYYGEGLNYREANLEPVFLIFQNKGDETPKVLPAEVRGVAPDGEYLAYSVDEAERLVVDSDAFSNTAANVARSGGFGALAGAGLGALLGTIGGGDNIWKGAVIGGTAGGAIGGGKALSQSEQEFKRVVRQDLEQYAWTAEEIPPHFTKVGYIYFPADVGISKIKVTVRGDDDIQTYTLPVTDMVSEDSKER